MKPTPNRFHSALWNTASAVIVIALSSGISQAAPKYWDLNGTTSGLGAGTGTWDLSATNWNTATAGTAATVAFVSGDDAFFQTAGVNTVTLGASLTANSITQATNTTATTINTGGGTAITVTTGNITNSGNSALVINPEIVLGATGTINATNAITLGGVVSGFGITKTGGNTLTLSGANSYTGATTINGGTVVLGGANGAITTSSSITVNNGGTMSYDNTAAANPARLGTTQGVTLNSGTFNYKALAAGNSTGQAGLLTLGAGLTSFISTTAATSPNTSTLTLNALSFGSHATLSASLANANTAQGRLAFTTAPTLTNDILPNGIETTTGNFLTIQGGFLGGYSNIGGAYQTGASGTWTATDNVNLTTGTTTVNAANTTINALAIKQTAAATLDLNGQTFTIDSGGILSTGNFTSTIQNGTLTAGAGNELYLWNTGTSVQTINSVIANNGNAVAVTKAGANTSTLGGANTYTGATTVSGGTLNISATGSTNAASAVTINTGGTLTNSGTIGGNVTAWPSTGTNTANFTNSATLSGSLTLKPGTSVPVITGNAAVTGTAILNGGSTTGTILNDGQLNINGSTALTVGTISSTNTTNAGQGAIYYSNTFASGNSLTLAAGTSLQRFAPGANSVGTLNTAGTVYLYSYGQTDNTYFNITFGSGTWNIGQMGQNNTGAQTGGTTNILGAATINLGATWTGNQAGSYMHGIYNIGGASSGTMAITNGFSEGNGRSTAPSVNGINGLQFTVGNGGSLTTGGASTLGFSFAQTAVIGTNSLTVNAGGSAALGGALTLGSTVANTFMETNATTVAGGTLTVTGGAVTLGNTGTAATLQTNTFTVSSGSAAIGTQASAQNLTIGTATVAASNTITNTATLSGGKLLVSGTLAAGSNTTTQTNSFSWTGGQLSARTITPGTGFNGGGSITTTTLTNSAGTLAPGDVGTAGKTTINGTYTMSGGALAIDIGGTTQAAAFQDGIAKYDTVAVTGAVTLGGTLNISLINSFTPANGNTYTVISGSSVTGAFSNLSSGRVTVGAGSFLVTNTGTSITLSDYSASAASDYASWAATNAPTGTAADDFDGDGVTNGVEYVLGGTKLTNDLGKLPVISTSAGNMVFTFYRDQASIDGTTTVNIQVGTTLASWPATYNVPDTAVANNPGVTVLKNNPSAGTDKVTLTVVQSPDAKKFARLNVSVTP